jgi:fructokinase
MNPLWGIDLGGTKIEAAILESREDTTPLKRLRVPTEAHLGYEHVLNQVEKVVNMLASETGIKPSKIGIGHPGTLDPITNTIKNCNATALNGRPFKADLERMMGIQVNLANDANCFAVAEALMGAVPDVLPNAEVVFGVILGTGVGGGIVVRGKVLNGRQGIAGEWGHNPLDETGNMCFCGRKGCVEKIIAGPSLEWYYHSISGKKLPMKDILERATAGTDANAVKTIDRLCVYFGKAMGALINILDPDVIVLGGGVGTAVDRLYTDGLEEVKKHIVNPRLDTIFVRPKLGDSAGVFGAALL